MVTLLAKIFIKDSEDKIKQREAYGMLCGVIGILFNVLLFIGKFLAGTLSNSIAITADAFNNLSDAGSSIVTLLGFKLAGAKPDTEHPFGHGRIEYVSGLVVAAAILLMGYELVRDSIGKIMHPEETEFTLLVAVILIASILVKLYMAYYNRAIGKKLDSAAMKAVATDSLSDTAATTVVLLASIFTHFTGIKIDGYCGLVVGLLVGYAGFDAARETLNPLLGQPPAHEFVEKIDEIVMSHSEVCGMHDLIVHDYGPGRQMISLHAEVPAEGNILELHDVIDNIENELLYVFDLNSAETFKRSITENGKVKTQKTPTYPDDWKNQFGLPVVEHRKSMQVNTFDNYAVFSLNPEQEKTSRSTESRGDIYE